MRPTTTVYRESGIQPLNWRQIRTLTAASIKSRYRNTVAGLLWVIMSPVLMYSAQGYVFRYVLHIAHANYPLFLLTGLMPWIFLTSSITMSAPLLISNARLFKSFPIHPFASLFSILLDNLINFALTFGLILTFLIVFGTTPNLTHFLFMPIAFGFLFVAVFSLSWLVCCLQVFFHDVKFIMDFAFSVLFFMTPIFYPIEIISPQYRWIVYANPIAMLLRPLQALSENELPANYWLLMLRCAAVAFTCAGIAALFWRRKKNDIYFRL